MTKQLKLQFGIALTLLIIGGALFGLQYFLKQRYVSAAVPSTATLPVSQTTAPENVTANAMPDKLLIPSLNLSLPIIPGYYNEKTGQWTLTNDKVQFAMISTQPNTEAGTTFLYGHARREVFANLHKLSSPAEAIVMTHDGRAFTYVYQGVHTLNPGTNDFDAFDPTVTPSRLIIQTCSGLLWQDRDLHVFELAGVKG